MRSVKSVILLVVLLAFASSCQRDNIKKAGDILPAGVYIDIPNSISSEETTKYLATDTVAGIGIYNRMRYFVNVGEKAAYKVNQILELIRKYELNRQMSFSYTSSQDGRVKHVNILRKKEFEGKTWQYQMTIRDAALADSDDLGIGLQMFWNTTPAEGIIIMKPENINLDEDPRWGDGLIRIDYSMNPQTTNGYDQTMTVSIAQMPASANDRFSIRALKMFVGRSGDRVDLYGSSNHPYAWLLLSSKRGLAWTFTASGYESSDIAVAEVGLPPNTLNSSSRDVLLKQYSIRNVLSEQYTQWFFDTYGRYPTAEELADYLSNSDAPGFFNRYGFVSAGTEPDSRYTPLKEAIEALTPYNPNLITNLRIEFKVEDIE